MLGFLHNINAKAKLNSFSYTTFIREEYLNTLVHHPILTNLSSEQTPYAENPVYLHPETKTIELFAARFRPVGILKTLLNPDALSDIEPAIIGRPLVYPNPFRLDKEPAYLGYELSKPLDIELQFFDIFGHRIAQKYLSSASGEEGTKGGADLANYNKIALNKTFFDNFDLPAGVYFYFIFHNQKCLGRGKMAIVP
jgi:hypothetical protein